MNVQMNNFTYFVNNYDSLFKQYGVAYIVIREEKVIGTYSSFSEAYRETIKDNELGTFNIQACNGDESGYTNYIASCEVCSV